MGGDGGSIPGRADLVRTKQKAEQVEKSAELAGKWTICAIGQDHLREPIVACELGRLYNKETILQFLLDRGKYSCAPSFSHIKSLKDVHELRLTPNPEKTKNQVAAHFICPVVGLEMNGYHRFCYFVSCGCVFSEKAFKMLNLDSCHKCGAPLAAKDMVILNPDEDTRPDMRARMEERKALRSHSKKRKRNAPKDSTASDTPSEPKKHSKSVAINPAMAQMVPKGSIQNDPKSSAAFKSLFSTSKEAKDIAKAGRAKTSPWVTYNPHYAMR